MKAGWQVKKLGEVCKTVQDGAHQSPQRQFDAPGVGRFLYITSKNIRNNHLDLSNVSYVGREFHDQIFPHCQPRLGDVLLTKDGANTGNVTLNTIAEPFSLLSSVCLIKTDPTALTSGFLCYYLQSPRGLSRIIGEMTGAAIKRIVLRDIKRATIPFPSLAEQRRIVGILDEAFDGIATAKANAEKNLQNARALFESHLQAVFTQRGERWTEKPLGDLATFRNGINYTKGSKGERVKIVGVKDFQKSYWVPSQNLDTVTIDGELSELDVLKQNDILAVRSNGNPELIGRCILAKEVSDRISHSGFTIRIRLSAGEVLPEYICHFMKCTSSRKQLTEGGTGINIKSLNQQTLSALRVPYPSISRQRSLVARLESLSTETQRLESIYQQKLAALDALKKSLLDQAFTGLL